MSDVQSQTRPGISRRTVAKGMAWSVPAVAVATAAPAMAASGGGITLQYQGACKNAGSSCKVRPKGYTFTYTVCNPTSRDVYIYGATIVSTTLTDLTFANTEPPSSQTAGALIPRGQCVNIAFNAASGKSGNLTFTATISVAWGHTRARANDTEHAAVMDTATTTGTPPDCVCPS